MATCIATPNVQRYTLPEIQIDRDNSGIIDLIDEVVERVMSAHYRRHRILSIDQAAFKTEMDRHILVA